MEIRLLEQLVEQKTGSITSFIFLAARRICAR
jgi:hypothetical protein